MTVGIAAITQGMVVLASDRMLTAGDIQFEPSIQKAYQVTKSILVLHAGDTGFHREVLYRVLAETRRRADADPNRWLEVREVARMFVDCRNEIQLERSESAILAPLGLDRRTFWLQQSQMNHDVTKSIAADMINFALPSTEVLVAGVDMRTGFVAPSIYIVDEGNMHCADHVGFAAIGSGARHAVSRFMVGGYNPAMDTAETLLTVFAAKKLAEIAPGVGADTDMYYIGPPLGAMGTIGDHVHKRLKEVHEDHKAREKQALSETLRTMKDYVDELVTAGNEAPATTASEQATGTGTVGDSPVTAPSPEDHKPDGHAPRPV